MKIGKRTNSNHRPIEVEIQTKRETKIWTEEENTQIEIEDRLHQGRQEYRNEIQEITFNETELQEKMEELVRKVKESIKKKK